MSALDPSLMIRRATEADVPAMTELIRLSISHPRSGAELGNRLLLKAEEPEVREYVRHATVLVAEVAGTVVGFIIAYGRSSPLFSKIAPYLAPSNCGDGWHMNWIVPAVRDEPRMVYVDKKTVHPDFRRRGIASALYVVLEREMPGSIFMGATVKKPFLNPASLGFRVRHGFTHVGTFNANEFAGYKDYESDLYIKNPPREQALE